MVPRFTAQSVRGRYFSFNRGDSDASDANAKKANKSPCDDRGNPINIATGNKTDTELDFASAGESPLRLFRTYNHYYWHGGLFGKYWLSDFDYRLTIRLPGATQWQHTYCMGFPGQAECADTSQANYIQARRPDGRVIAYTSAGGGVFYESKPDPVSKIVRQADGSWLLYGEDGQTELYSKGGYPQRITFENGVSWTFTHGGTNGTQLQRVTHSNGRTVDFIWDPYKRNQIWEVRDPAGNRFQYTYGTEVPNNQLLKGMTTPGAPSVTYHYAREEGTSPDYNPLVGKSFNGTRYSWFTYDANGYATSTEHAGGAERYSFVYTPAAGGLLTVKETNPLGKQATYVFKDGLVQNVTGHPSNACAGAYSETTYDANGNVDLVADFNENFTNFDYDDKGRLQKEVAAFGTPLAHTTTYVWDDAGNRVTRIVEEGVRQTDYSYAGGRIAAETVTNLSSNGVLGQSLTTRYNYTFHPNGLVATTTEDGPLSGDTVTYTYSAVGDLVEVKNGLGHAVQYSGYDAMGRPGRVTGANGEVTEIAYDVRGRVTAVKAIVNGAAQTTTYSYNSLGQLTSVQAPDGQQRNFVYDAAYRQIEEYERELDGSYSRRLTSYNAMSLPTQVEVQRSAYPHDTRVIGNIEGVGSDYVIRGWACATGMNGSIDLHLYAGTGWPADAFLGSFRADKPSEPAIAASCAAQGDAYRIAIPLTEAMRDAHGGKKIYVHGISPNNINHALVAGSGSHSIPRLPPNAAPANLSAPSQSVNGSYTVTWSATSRATSYRLEESVNGGGWTLAHNDGATSKGFTGKSAANYSYRVTGCNESGCGPYSGSVTVAEIDPPGAPPSIFAPAVNARTDFTVYWTSLAGATSYQLEESAGGGAWTLIQHIGGTSVWLGGKPTGIDHSYRVRGCNAAGCGAASAPITVQRIIYGAQFVWQGLPVLHMFPGQTYSVIVQMRNTGNTAWSAGDAYSLGSYGDSMAFGLNRVPVSGVVQPGEIASFQFNVIGPQPYNQSSFQYRTFHWGMVRDGYTWFGEFSPPTNISIEYTPPPKPCENPPRCEQEP